MGLRPITSYYSTRKEERPFHHPSCFRLRRVKQYKDDGLGRACLRLGEGYTPFLDKAYTLTDVLLCDPHTTDVLDVLYHVV